MCLYLIIHVKICQDKNMTCHRNPSLSNYICLLLLGISGRHLLLKIAAPTKQSPSHHWILTMVHTGPRFAHDFQPSVYIRLCNKIVQATSRRHTKS
jgi:hypothetical protein